MKKMSVIEAAQHFQVSKEAIHNRIRRGSLQSVVEDGVKLVLIDENAPVVHKTKSTSTALDERYYKLLEEQNINLQKKVELLEDEIRLLRDQKEQMLKDEKQKIEQVYKEKDEQLKQILHSFQMQQQFLVSKPQQPLEVEIEEVKEITKEDGTPKVSIISLKKYLKMQKMSDIEVKKITKKLKKKIDKDERVIMREKKIYLNLEKYDYSDLL